MIKKNPW